MKMTLEICVDSLGGLVVARQGGADRVEVCSALGLGGLTPTYGMMRAAGAQAMAMIRPRAGGFIWSGAEVAAMTAEIGLARELGLTGVVIGAMDRAGRLDLAVMRELVMAAKGMDITLHRVVDLLDDPALAVELAADLDIGRILTSGGATRAIDGIAVLGRMVAAAQGRVSIMAGAGLCPDHIAPLAAIGITEFHASASLVMAEDARLARFGFASSGRRETDAGQIKALKSAITALS